MAKKMRPKNISSERFSMLDAWFTKRYKGTKDDTLRKFNEWLKIWGQGEDYALSVMDDKGKQIWQELLNDKICVIVHPDLEDTVEHSLKADKNVTVEGNTEGRIKQVCLPAAYGLKNIENRIPKILEKDEVGCSLCKVGGTESIPTENKPYDDPKPVPGNNLRDPTTDEWEHERKRVREMDDSKLAVRMTRILNPQKMYNFGVVLEDEGKSVIAKIAFDKLQDWGWDNTGKWVGKGGTKTAAATKPTPTKVLKKITPAQEVAEKMIKIHGETVESYGLDDDADWTPEEQKKYIEDWLYRVTSGTFAVPIDNDTVKELLKYGIDNAAYRLYELFVRYSFISNPDKKTDEFKNDLIKNDDGLFSGYFTTFDPFWMDVYDAGWWKEVSANPFKRGAIKNPREMRDKIFFSKTDAMHFMETLIENGIDDKDINFDFDESNNQWLVDWIGKDVPFENPSVFTPGTPDWFKKEYEFEPLLEPYFDMRVSENVDGKTVYAIQTYVEPSSVDEPFDVTPIFYTFDELVKYWTEYGNEILEMRDDIGDREEFQNWVMHFGHEVQENDVLNSLKNGLQKITDAIGKGFSWMGSKIGNVQIVKRTEENPISRNCDTIGEIWSDAVARYINYVESVLNDYREGKTYSEYPLSYHSAKAMAIEEIMEIINNHYLGESLYFPYIHRMMYGTAKLSESDVLAIKKEINELKEMMCKREFTVVARLFDGRKQDWKVMARNEDEARQEILKDEPDINIIEIKRGY